MLTKLLMSTAVMLCTNSLMCMCTQLYMLTFMNFIHCHISHCFGFAFLLQVCTWTPRLVWTSSSLGGTLTERRSSYLEDHWAELLPSTLQHHTQTETSEIIIIKIHTHKMEHLVLDAAVSIVSLSLLWAFCGH